MALVKTIPTWASKADPRHALKLDSVYWVAVSVVLVASLAVRVIGIGWGIPNYSAARMPNSAYRNSYHLDEDNYLWALALMKPGEGNFDLHDYHWGTLQYYLIYGALVGSEATGIVPAPWESAFRNGDIAVLPRLYLLGRLVSLAAGVIGALVVAALGRLIGGWIAGIVAGLAYAVAPLAVVEAHYLTSDVLMSVLVAASLLAGALALQRESLRLLVLSGVLLGLATAAKYSAAFAVPGLLVAQAGLWRLPHPHGKRLGLAPVLLLPLAGAACGFIVAEPFTIIAPNEVLDGLRQAAAANAPASIWDPSVMFYLIVWHATNLGKLGLTWPLALLGLGGSLLMFASVAGRAAGPRAPGWLRKKELPPVRPSLVLLAGGLGLVISLVVNRVLVLRYDQPLVPLAAVAAGVVWAWLPAWWLRALAGGAALAVACIITLGQLSLLAGPHTANQLLAWIDTHVKPGQTIAQVWPEYPPLDGGAYTLVRIDPWRPQLPEASRPDFVILDDMTFNPPEPELRSTLARDYRPVVTFAAEPSIGPFSWNEGATPHDWKYSHPTFTVYSLK